MPTPRCSWRARIAKWSLGPKAGHDADAFQLVETLPVHCNIGHLVRAEGDTVSPAAATWSHSTSGSIDRFPPVGTLHAQNFRLIDLTSEPMRILSDAPIGRDEPHYVQRIHRDKLEGVLQLYEPGTDPMTWSRSQFAIVAGEERIERQGQDLHVSMSATRSHHTPDVVATGRHRPVPHHEHRADAGCDARLRDR